MAKLIIVSFFTFVFFATAASGGEMDTTRKKSKDCIPRDISEIIFKKEIKQIDTAREFDMFILPYIAYSPTKGFQLGAGGTLSWYVGSNRVTRQSAASATVEFTSKNQKLLQLKSNVYSDRNRWFLQGDWRYYFYSLPTYGLGTGYNNPVISVEGLETDSSSIPGWNQSYQVDYRWFRLHEIFSRRIVENFYAGIGYHLDLHYKIEDVDLKKDTPAQVFTPHYSYSVLHGFDPEQYVASGLSLNFVYDSRDNLINPYKGYYANVNVKMNGKWLGSSKNSSQLWAEFRTYVGLEKKLPRHLFAFWAYGGFQLSGEVPYFDLWATGFDQMNSSGRGYLQGRWRGQDLVYGEVEYRFPISRCSQVLGGVIFINASTASSRDQDIQLLKYIRPAAGAGLRIMVAKQSRTNLVIDVTIAEKSVGIYFSAQEAF